MLRHFSGWCVNHAGSQRALWVAVCCHGDWSLMVSSLQVRMMTSLACLNTVTNMGQSALQKHKSDVISVMLTTTVMKNELQWLDKPSRYY